MNDGVAYTAQLEAEDDVPGWRAHVRSAIARGIAPERIRWLVAEEGGDLLASVGVPLEAVRSPPPLSVPKAALQLVSTALLHREHERFVLCHQLIADLAAKRRRLDDRADPLVAKVEALAKSVRRDIHKMHAFVRFRAVEEEGADTPRYVAWFEPDHHIVRANAGFFVNRFASMRWSILTPEMTLHWDGQRVTEGPGAVRGDAPEGDPVEDTWRRYYASIFNPARVKVKAMMKEMPKKYWANMPETALIPELIAGAQARSAAMLDASAAKVMAVAASPASRPAVQPPPLPSNILPAWQALRDEARACTRCPLHLDATQMVFGEGPLDAALVIVGEQPGDQEDLAGRPFVGPAGQLFDAALEEAGIDRSRLYVTNAVKHFSFVRRGKRRIHQTPTANEISACRWWLDRELELVQPKLVLAMGASAARSLLGKAVTISRVRDTEMELANGLAARVTVHPSYLLRLPDPEVARMERERFVDDLRAAHQISQRLVA